MNDVLYEQLEKFNQEPSFALNKVIHLFKLNLVEFLITISEYKHPWNGLFRVCIVFDAKFDFGPSDAHKIEVEWIIYVRRPSRLACCQ